MESPNVALLIAVLDIAKEYDVVLLPQD